MNPDGTSNWTGCDSSLTINPAVNTSYDVQFDFVGKNPFIPANSTYRVYAKIVDTVSGNSAPGGGNLKAGGGVVDPGATRMQPIPYIYAIEIDAENPANPAERAKLSVLYQY